MADLAPGWLARAVAAAHREVESWPPETRARLRAWAARLPEPDPCTNRTGCAEAQTCIGGCGLWNRRT